MIPNLFGEDHAQKRESREETMSGVRRAGRMVAGLAVLVSLAGTRACAQTADYPNRKITFLVGFAPGGGIDTFARVIAQALNEQLGYQIIVENRAGAASNVAAKLV